MKTKPEPVIINHPPPKMWTPSQLEAWEIDLTTGAPILTFEKCSVIQDKQAYLVMQLLCKHYDR